MNKYRLPFRALVAGHGAALPERVLSNAELAERVDTSDEWIVERTGIRQRHIAAEGEYTSDLGAAAARAALANAGLGASDIDLIIVATATPDLTFPSTASIIQRKLGIARGAAFDLQAVCTGFVYALATAEKFLATGQHQCALVIGAETFSRILDWEDRRTCVLFGDGAGAMVLQAVPTDEAGDRGIMASHLCCDGSMTELLFVDGGPSTTGTTGKLRMDGNRVFREAVGRISEAMVAAAAAADIPLSAVDWFVPHQANQRIIGGVVKRLDLDPQRVVSAIAMHGNTSAASIPLAYAAAREDGRIQPGQLVMIEGMGGGLTWGAALFRL